MEKEHVAFLEHNMLVLVVSGLFTFETSREKITRRKGQMLLIGKNQLAQITKTPLPGEVYETIVISLQESLIRQMALDEHIQVSRKYTGAPNVVIPGNDFLHGYFQSVMPYVRHAAEKIPDAMGALKVREAVTLLMHLMPELRNFLFDFSEPYKIDLKKFMLSNFHFNVPVEKFAQLTGRSLAGFKRDFQKTFGAPPRHWLQDQRLAEARHLIEKKKLKPSAIYLDLGFETLSHFSNAFKKKFGKAPSAW
jgi:AraC family transcriptional regulator, exoenzyme S synthesis regulatory protein ExsA